MTKPQSLPAKPTGRPCKCCQHPNRVELDRALVAGTPVPELSRRFAVSPDSLRNHRRHHVPTAPQAAALAERIEAEGDHAIDLLARATSLLTQAEALLTESRADNDRRNAIMAVRECARTIELLGKLKGEISADTTVNVMLAPALMQLQTVVLVALAPFPDARHAVAAALANLSGPVIEHDPTLALPGPR